MDRYLIFKDNVLINYVVYESLELANSRILGEGEAIYPQPKDSEGNYVFVTLGMTYSDIFG